MSRNKTGRLLCFVLRHHPEAIGITVDEHGWADVEALVRGMQTKMRFSREELDELVRDDEKQRYTYNADRSKIRANQGHSIPVDLEMEALVPPDVLWHGSARRFDPSIQEYGLIPGSRLHVHLSSDPATAKAVGARHGTPVVYEVLSGQMYQDGYTFYRSQNGVWLTKAVPARYLNYYSVD